MYVLKTIVLLCSTTSLMVASEFPAYLQKCKNDEHLNECFMKSAEAGVLNILEGDHQLGIPSYLPINIPDYTMGTKECTLEIENLTAALSGLKINETKWDTDKMNIVIRFNYQQVTWDYNGKLDGKFLGQPVCARGHFKHIYENGMISCNLQYVIIEADGEKYANIIGRHSDYFAEKITYIFENMDDDMQQFINKNYEKFDDLIHKQVNELLFGLYSLPFRVIFQAVPYDQLFIV